MIKLSIVIPCYNESGNIPHLLAAYDQVILRDDIEVIIVDNGSTDDTANILSQLASEYERFLTITTIPENKGYGFGVLSGLKKAKGEFLGITHGDLQTSPSDVIRALAIIEASDTPQNLYVKGLRTGRPLFDQFFTIGMSIFETIYMRVRLYDINAQPNVFHRSFYESWNNPPHDFALDLYILYMAQRQKLQIIRFRVPFPSRIHGSSKWNTGLSAKWKFIKRTILFSTSLKKHLK